MTFTPRSYFGNDHVTSYYDDTRPNSYFSEEDDAFTDDADDTPPDMDGVSHHPISFLQVFSSISRRWAKKARRLVNSMGLFASKTHNLDQLTHIDIQSRVCTAKDFFDNRQYTAVIDTLSACRRVAPKDHLISFLLGASYYHLDNNISARDLLRAATKAKDTDPLYHYYLGLTYRDLKELLFAARYLEMAEAFSKTGSDINQACKTILDEIRRQNRVKPILSANPRIHNYGVHILSCVACLSLGIYLYAQTNLIAFLGFSFFIVLGIVLFIAYDKYSNKYQISENCLKYCYGMVKVGKMPAKTSICKEPQIKKRTFVDALIGNYWLNIVFMEPLHVIGWFGRKVEIKELWIPSLGDATFMNILLDFFTAHGSWAKFVVESQTDRQK